MTSPSPAARGAAELDELSAQGHSLWAVMLPGGPVYGLDGADWRALGPALGAPTAVGVRFRSRHHWVPVPPGPGWLYLSFVAEATLHGTGTERSIVVGHGLTIHDGLIKVIYERISTPLLTVAEKGVRHVRQGDPRLLPYGQEEE